MTNLKGQDGISPYPNLSDERGLAEQGLYGLDTAGQHADEEDTEESENSGHSQSENIDENDAAPEDIKIGDEPAAWEEAPVRTTRNPTDPTSEERTRHDATHLPFRPWCPVCIEAALSHNCGGTSRGQGADMCGLVPDW